MICKKCNNPGVLNSVMNKEFYYCRTCKDEIIDQSSVKIDAEYIKHTTVSTIIPGTAVPLVGLPLPKLSGLSDIVFPQITTNYRFHSTNPKLLIEHDIEDNLAGYFRGNPSFQLEPTGTLFPNIVFLNPKQYISLTWNLGPLIQPATIADVLQTVTVQGLMLMTRYGQILVIQETLVPEGNLLFHNTV